LTQSIRTQANMSDPNDQRESAVTVWSQSLCQLSLTCSLSAISDGVRIEPGDLDGATTEDRIWVIPLGLKRELAGHRGLRRISDRFQIAINCFGLGTNDGNKLAH
jgi:hypothetical protein